MKNILIFNDISGLGNCSMAVNLPVFAHYGHYCMPVPTAVYSCQTGFADFSVLANPSVRSFAATIVSHRAPDAVYVGFCQNADVVTCVADVICNLTHPAYCTLVDPVMGDNGKLYPVFDDNYVLAIRRVVRHADIITPNVTEACLLADIDYTALSEHIGKSDFADICAKVFATLPQKLGVINVVVTGIDCGQRIGNLLLVHGLSPQVIYNPKIEGVYSGTGDLFSSVLLGKLLVCNDLPLSVKTAADFVCLSLQQTQCDDRRFGTEFCRVLNELK